MAEKFKDPVWHEYNCLIQCSSTVSLCNIQHPNREELSEEEDTAYITFYFSTKYWLNYIVTSKKLFVTFFCILKVHIYKFFICRPILKVIRILLCFHLPLCFLQENKYENTTTTASHLCTLLCCLLYTSRCV